MSIHQFIELSEGFLTIPQVRSLWEEMTKSTLWHYGGGSDKELEEQGRMTMYTLYLVEMCSAEWEQSNER